MAKKPAKVGGCKNCKKAARCCPSISAKRRIKKTK